VSRRYVRDAKGRFATTGSAGGGADKPAVRAAGGASGGTAMVPVNHLDGLSIRYGDDPTESPYFPGDKTVTALVADMKHGVRMPVTVETDGKLGILSDGNHRVAAAKIAGIEALPTRFVRVKSRYVQRGGGAPLPDSIQKHLKKHPNAVRAAVPRQPSWQQGER
jgi:hypothetical protein